jgi:hypothetical protein
LSRLQLAVQVIVIFIHHTGLASKLRPTIFLGRRFRMLLTPARPLKDTHVVKGEG